MKKNLSSLRGVKRLRGEAEANQQPLATGFLRFARNRLRNLKKGIASRTSFARNDTREVQFSELRSLAMTGEESPSAHSLRDDGNSLNITHYTNEHGAILLIVLIIILTISLLGATLMALFFNVLSLSQIELDRARALYLAEAGIAKAVGALKNQAGAPVPSEVKPGSNPAEQLPDRIIPPTKLGEGHFEVYNDFSQSTIISIGTSNGVKRTIQVRYNAF